VSEDDEINCADQDAGIYFREITESVAGMISPILNYVVTRSVVAKIREELCNDFPGKNPGATCLVQVGTTKDVEGAEVSAVFSITVKAKR